MPHAERCFEPNSKAIGKRRLVVIVPGLGLRLRAWRRLVECLKREDELSEEESVWLP